MWEYWVEDGVRGDTTQIFNIKDSVSADGRIYLTRKGRFINPVIEGSPVKYIVDTSNGEVIGPSHERTNVPIYRFNSQLGDQWVTYDYSAEGCVCYEMARVKEVYNGVIFGRNTTLMRMHYYLSEDSTDTLGLDRYWDTLAKGLGLVDRFFAEGGTFYSVKGAVINGVLYGDTTNIVTSVSTDYQGIVPSVLQLHQNYPNPFNPTTTIGFSLSVSGSVSLIVYDALGREIRRLIDNEGYSRGVHWIVWDGMTTSNQSTPNGVYYYRLVTDGTASTRSMILIK